MIGVERFLYFIAQSCAVNRGKRYFSIFLTSICSMLQQPQLLPIALNPRDVVYTPDSVARDVVNFFKPTGRILEPSAGDGAFLRYLPPDTDWCEIEKGRDFFACHEHYDWIIGNPPFSIFTEWLAHSFELADNVVYVMMFSSLVNSMARLKQIEQYGGVRTNYILGSAKDVGMADFGYTCSAVHFQRGYKGGMFTVFRNATALPQPTVAHSLLATP